MAELQWLMAVVEAVAEAELQAMAVHQQQLTR